MLDAVDIQEAIFMKKTAMVAGVPSSRERILEAASDIARESGPGNLSLDAVAARAGLSKGGLLYNFPSKASLMEALVEMHVERTRAAMRTAEESDTESANPVASAFINVYQTESCSKQPPASGVLAAIAENPEFIAPIMVYKQELVERIRTTDQDHEMGCIAFLAIEGMRALRLFETDVFTRADEERLLARLSRLLSKNGGY
jgi:AcrR family transcriptional regulator